MDESSKTFVVYNAVLETFLGSAGITIDPSQAGQITGDKPMQVVVLQ